MKKIVFLLFNFCSFISYAQQDSQYTQYMYNSANFNPAYIGSAEYLTAVLLHRNQWIGFEGAPVTNSFSIYAPLKKKVAMGANFINDKIGPSNESYLALDFSYTINLNETYKLAFGIKASASLLNVDYTLLNIYQPDELEFASNIENKFYPNIGTGLFLYNDNSYLGLSVPNILEATHIEEYKSSLAKESFHVYLTAGYIYELSDLIKVKPALLTKYVKNAPIQFDTSVNLLFNDKFTLGAAYRWSKAFSAMAGFQITNQWMIGYAYDDELTNLANYNSGSHEIILKYDLGIKKYKRLLTPRFF